MKAFSPTRGGLPRYNIDAQGIAYFWTRDEAEQVREAIRADYPQAWIACYTLGFAVATGPGEYLGRTAHQQHHAIRKDVSR